MCMQKKICPYFRMERICIYKEYTAINVIGNRAYNGWFSEGIIWHNRGNYYKTEFRGGRSINYMYIFTFQGVANGNATIQHSLISNDIAKRILSKGDELDLNDC